jgi:hypothetical protein
MARENVHIAVTGKWCNGNVSGEFRRQHLVTVAIQRLFARERNLIYYIDTRTSIAELKPVMGTFWVQDFMSFDRDAWVQLAGPGGFPPGLDTTLETYCGKVETEAVKAVRRLLRMEPRAADYESLRALAALHHARSQGFKDRNDQLFRGDGNPIADKLMAQPEVMESYKQLHGHCPTRDELLDAIEKTNLHLVFAIRDQYNAIYAQFRQMHLALLHPAPGYGFVYGDTPVLYVNATPNGDTLGLREGAKWGKGHASQFIWPISRGAAIILQWEPPVPNQIWLKPEACVRLNQLQWRSTGRYIGCHPDDNPSKLLGTDITIKQPRRSKKLKH